MNLTKLKNSPKIYHVFVYFTFLSLLAVFASMVLGSIVRMGDAGMACNDWPMCMGKWSPPVEANALMNYMHRVATAIIFPLLVGSMWTGRFGLAIPHVWKLLKLTMGLYVLQILVGWLITSEKSSEIQTIVSVTHLVFSLAMLATLSAGLIFTIRHTHNPIASLRLAYGSRFGRMSLALFIALFVLLLSGGLLSNTQSGTICSSWPLCNGRLVPIDLVSWINIIHRIMVLLTGLLMVVTYLQAWRSQRFQTAILVSTTAGFVLFMAQALLGVKMVDGFPVYLLVLHQVTAVGVWIAFVVQVILNGVAIRTHEDELREGTQTQRRAGLWKDFLMLTKPVVVILLLVTTFAGMVIGAQEWPPIEIVFWTLVGGFMAAGGSGAINQYIDRDDDGKMQRTQKRPIPSGRLTPGEGLAFGVAMVLASFYLMTAYVNFLAALLVLAGIVYYVLIYSVFLKKTTVQNIVIGGGAGAIPPLVGWAAVTGSLNIPALFLFAIVFMWTPPHFWALALVRRNDYARAGVPMLPVVRGEKTTRWQIFLYTIELVALTLLLPLFGLGGSIYLISAILFGIWLLTAAWKVWKLGGNKLAWKMYRYSSMYLAFLFIALMVDRLIG